MHSSENKIHHKMASIILPTYNRAHKIKLAMDSVFFQTYRPIEIVIIDDGSSDFTYKVVQEWKLRCETPDLKVRYFFQKNQGAPAARNLGIKKAKGRYLQFLDSDDYLCPQKLEKQIGQLQKEHTPISVCSYTHLDKSGKILFTSKNDRTIQQILRSPFSLSSLISVIDRKRIAPKLLLWNPKLKKFQDRDFHYKIFMIIDRFSKTEEVLFHYHRYSEGGIYDSIKDTSNHYSASLKSLLIFHFKNLSKVKAYKLPPYFISL